MTKLSILIISMIIFSLSNFANADGYSIKKIEMELSIEVNYELFTQDNGKTFTTDKSTADFKLVTSIKRANGYDNTVVQNKSNPDADMLILRFYDDGKVSFINPTNTQVENIRVTRENNQIVIAGEDLAVARAEVIAQVKKKNIDSLIGTGLKIIKNETEQGALICVKGEIRMRCVEKSKVVLVAEQEN